MSIRKTIAAAAVAVALAAGIAAPASASDWWYEPRPTPKGHTLPVLPPPSDIYGVTYPASRTIIGDDRPRMDPDQSRGGYRNADPTPHVIYARPGTHYWDQRVDAAYEHVSRQWPQWTPAKRTKLAQSYARCLNERHRTVTPEAEVACGLI